MKFRKLKKTDFVLHNSDGFYVCKKGKLYGYYEWEYDNGLYITEGIEKDNKALWKAVKRILSNKDEQYDFQFCLSNGKCPRCGKLLTEENYKDEIDEMHLKGYFERDYYYCNDCKQKQIDDFVEFMNNYEDGE